MYTRKFKWTRAIFLFFYSISQSGCVFFGNFYFVHNIDDDDSLACALAILCVRFSLCLFCLFRLLLLRCLQWQTFVLQQQPSTTMSKGRKKKRCVQRLFAWCGLLTKLTLARPTEMRPPLCRRLSLTSFVLYFFLFVVAAAVLVAVVVDVWGCIVATAKWKYRKRV